MLGKKRLGKTKEKYTWGKLTLNTFCYLAKIELQVQQTKNSKSVKSSWSD